MLTPQDVRTVQFEKNLRGYRTEDVDRFLDKVEEQLEQNDQQAEQLRKQIAELTAENQRLHRELQSFEEDGEVLKSALINAQRMGENVIREANQKADDIIHRANLRGDDIIHDANELLQKAGDRADEIVSEANDKRLAQEREYERVRLEVTRFKSEVLKLYRNHVESLSNLPEYHPEDAAAEAPAKEQPAEGNSLQTAQPASAETAEPAEKPAEQPAPEADDTDAVEEDKDAESSEDFWAKDESQLKLDPPPADAKPQEPDYDACQGVQFSE